MASWRINPLFMMVIFIPDNFLKYTLTDATICILAFSFPYLPLPQRSFLSLWGYTVCLQLIPGCLQATFYIQGHRFSPNGRAAISWSNTFYFWESHAAQAGSPASTSQVLGLQTWSTMLTLCMELKHRTFLYVGQALYQVSSVPRPLFIFIDDECL